MRRSSVRVGVVVLIALTLGLASCGGGKFVASTASNKYHEPSCVWAESIDSDRRVWFDTTDEAEKAGYVPCDRCEPTEGE